MDRFLDQTDSIAQSEQLFDMLSAFAFNFDCPWVAYGPLAPDQKGFEAGPTGSGGHVELP
ncbi:hypothetical protein [Mesorhizobium sp. M6A.T.Ce.TU.002.03.1.1]|uniref:hypothetical protein n=1 Tax=Mesorhizobium sp. M6A.T.Ce.TU.002.03.1.1 TaxID=2496782 RepID=UPI001FDFC92B|nr:hypothetical protein [Mesorhizobium sp. M6A.T.Ce.TU.002.03.1.1]